MLPSDLRGGPFPRAVVKLFTFPRNLLRWRGVPLAFPIDNFFSFRKFSLGGRCLVTLIGSFFPLHWSYSWPVTLTSGSTRDEHFVCLDDLLISLSHRRSYAGALIVVEDQRPSVGAATIILFQKIRLAVGTSAAFTNVNLIILGGATTTAGGVVFSISFFVELA